MDTLYTKRVGTHNTEVGVYEVIVPKPPFGCACYMLEGKGVYQLFKGEGVLVSISCTHVGVGAVDIFDGVIDENGNLVGEYKALYKANPQTMCLWIMNAGVSKGLVARAVGGDKNIPVFFTISWLEK